ncbi:putative nuclease HARBI1 [Synchiropus splendidus]|uniref:putative nuclease HARBI1 n=1 Tax=Synchiropus splendidus TaxID=270530 RepID=UPI00237D3CB7|nr:putative nuclease HARBI1 [Synchiropus splendidus]
MATSTKAVLALALSEYKQLLDKYASLLQLSNAPEEEEAQRRRRIVAVLQLKSEPEWEMMLNMDDHTFVHRFHVTKPQFEYLAAKLRDNGLEKQHSHGLPAVPAMKKVLMFLWFMANQDSFRQISQRFDVSQSSAHRVVLQVLNIMSTIGTAFVSWPNADEKAASAAAFRRLCGIKGVIGAIDGCHIRIQRPPRRGGDYMNHKSFYSVLLQGIVDEKGRFTDIFAGPPGKVCDARMLRASDFYTTWQEKMGGHSLLGDSAYTGHAFPFVISPKCEEAPLTEADEWQNARIHCGRTVVEQAFGRMKCKWRRLRDLQNTRMDAAVMIILAACFLHNMCLGVTEICQEHPGGCPRLADENA